MCGTPVAKQPTGRERRRVSTVFIDLAAFTTLTQAFDPEELRDLADEILTVVAGIVESFDGYVDAFQGDGLIALFGAPHSHADDPQRAVLAAETGLRAIERLGNAKGTPLRGRAGVTTGIVIAGPIGSGRVRDYTVMGSTVNLAARLEAAAPPGEVWVGPETYRLTRHLFVYQETPPVELTGFPNITTVYRLSSSLEQQPPDPYHHLPFVGRERETTSLQQMFQSVIQSRQARELWLTGDTGSGKTRLLQEFANNLPPQAANVVWIEGKPTEHYSWEALARQLFPPYGGTDLEPESVRTVIEHALPGEPRWQHLILQSLDLADTKTWTRLERRSLNRTNLAWRDLLVALTERIDGAKPLILIVENTPEDEDLLEFLELLRQTPAAILIIRSSRGRKLPQGAETLPLAPLNHADSLSLLKHMSDPTYLVAARSLVGQVGGVPAAILELGRALSITPPNAFSGSLVSLLQARLDMLEPRPRRLLAHAALTGERCWEGLLRTLSEDRQHLEALQGEQVLVAEPSSSIPGEIEYRFQSELLRSSALQLVPFKDRPQLHLRIASWLEQHAPLALSLQVAEHFQAGGSDDAAYPHYLAAAERAAARGDAPEAFWLYDKILALELPPAALAQAALSYAQAALSAGQPQLARRLLSQAAGWIKACPAASRDELSKAQQKLLAEIPTGEVPSTS
jgi:class 3 adenylate cyclase/energy-coupling factor transporter ATP-binding protein EcfA2